MASFAERIGEAEPRAIIQIKELDAETRISLWNVIYEVTANLGTMGSYGEVEERVVGQLWRTVLKRPGDECPHAGAVWAVVKERILNGTWVTALGTIEEVLEVLSWDHALKGRGLDTVGRKLIDAVFKRCVVGYRFIGKEIVPIDNELDNLTVKQAISDVSGIGGAQQHLARAISLLSSRENPHFANVVKESISAVESVVKKITGEGTLGAGLKKLKANGVIIHPALETAWSKIYGWTSDSDGIRHGEIEPSEVDGEIAKYMLVSCSAFVSYLVAASRAAGNL